MKNFRFETDCIHSKGEWIQDMVDQAREITWQTFWRHVRRSQVENLFDGYAWGRGDGLHIEDDYAVSVYRSKYRGKPCYYICWSAIEYIFLAS